MLERNRKNFRNNMGKTKKILACKCLQYDRELKDDEQRSEN